MTRVGVIGAGSMGANHIRVYSEMDDIDLVGISDIDEKRANAMARRYGTKAFIDHRDLLKKNLDAVSIVVPTTLHEPVAISAIESGAHVLVEKPISDTLNGADVLIQAAKDADVKLMVGHIERFNPAVTKLKEIVDSGQLGKIVSISARRVGPYNPRIRDVGIILDLGVHDIDVISYLYGKKVSEVYTIASNDIHCQEDHASILMRFDRDRSGVLETNWLTPQKVRQLTVIGLGGVSYLDYMKQTVSIHDECWIRKAKVEKSEPLKQELRHFVDVAQNGSDPLTSGEEGRHALEVTLAAIRSSKERRAIKISEIRRQEIEGLWQRAR